EIAAARQARFVNVFDFFRDPTKSPPKEPRTINGLHLNESGYHQLSLAVAERLGWPIDRRAWVIGIGRDVKAFNGRGTVSDYVGDNERIKFAAIRFQLPDPISPSTQAQRERYEWDARHLFLPTMGRGRFRALMDGEIVDDKVGNLRSAEAPVIVDLSHGPDYK